MKLIRTVFVFIISISTVLATPKNLIVDTDIFSDVDDAGALLLAATHPNLNLLAVNVNYPSVYSVQAASAILAHYGHPHCPIGVNRPLHNNTFVDKDWELGEYASKIAFHWSGGTLPWGHAEEAWDAVALYRKVLSESNDESVTIVSIGFLDNLSALLNSTADSYSPLDGRALVNRKFTELVIMGGGYPSGHSWNFWGSSPSLSAHVINTWEGTVTFLGDDVGSDVLTALPLMSSDITTDPVRMAYIYYGYFTPRASWDPLAVLYAANGLGELFELGNEIGYNYVEPDSGNNKWVFAQNPDGKQKQHFLRLKVSNETAAKAIDDLFLEGAKRFAKNSGGPSRVAICVPRTHALVENHTEL